MVTRAGFRYRARSIDLWNDFSFKGLIGAADHRLSAPLSAAPTSTFVRHLAFSSGRCVTLGDG